MNPTFYRSFPSAFALCLGLCFFAAGRSQGQNPPLYPSSPLAPKSYTECSTLQRHWNDVYKRTDELHENCLESQRKAGVKGNPEAFNSSTCTFSGCQTLHTRKREIERRMDQAVDQCRIDVGNYLEGERRRREAEARAEAERRRITEENNRRIAEANRRAADEAAARRRAADAERQRRINETNRRVAGIEARRQALSNAIDSVFDPLIGKIREDSRQRAAEREEQRRIDEENAQRERENAAREQDDRERQQAEQQRLAYEDEARRSADESARRAREGAYTRDIIESDIAEREAGATRSYNSTDSDLGSRILEEMRSYQSEADSIFGTDAGLSIADLDLATNSYMPLAPQIDDSAIAPSKDSPMYDFFDRIRNTELPSGSVRWVNEKKDQLFELKEQLKQQFPEFAIETAQDKIIEKFTEEEDSERDWSKWSNGIKDIVYEKAIDYAKADLIDRVQNLYAKLRATREGESEPDPVLLDYYRTEAAAHPVTGLWSQLLSSKGNWPMAFNEYYKTLIERFAGLMGFATDEAFR